MSPITDLSKRGQLAAIPAGEGCGGGGGGGVEAWHQACWGSGRQKTASKGHHP